MGSGECFFMASKNCLRKIFPFLNLKDRNTLFSLCCLIFKRQAFFTSKLQFTKNGQHQDPTEWTESLSFGIWASSTSGIFCNSLQVNILEYNQRIIKLGVSWKSYVEVYFLTGGETKAQRDIFTFLKDAPFPGFLLFNNIYWLSIKIIWHHFIGLWSINRRKNFINNLLIQSSYIMYII